MRPLHIEVIYAGDHNLLCYYTAKVVEAVVPLFPDQITWEKVCILEKEGSRRFYELSVLLYGEEDVMKHHKHAPIPSIFINGELVCDHIPSVEELKEIINQFIELSRQG